METEDLRPDDRMGDKNFVKSALGHGQMHFADLARTLTADQA